MKWTCPYENNCPECQETTCTTDKTSAAAIAGCANRHLQEWYKALLRNQGKDDSKVVI